MHHVAHASQLTVSPDGKYAFAMVFGGDPAYYHKPYIVVVDIHEAKRVCGWSALSCARENPVPALAAARTEDGTAHAFAST